MAARYLEPGWFTRQVFNRTVRRRTRWGLSVAGSRELRVRGPGIMLHYFGDEESTVEVLREDWLLTGDLGYVDPDGFCHFMERKKDMLKPSGENVAASEIERVVTEYPGILECGVVGVPDPNRHEAVFAFIVTEPGVDIQADGLQAFCRERLAAFKVPAHFEFCEALPKTSIGKTQKGELRRLAAGIYSSERRGPGAPSS